MTILLFLVVSYVLLSISLTKIFEKAGENGWKALVPGLNFIVWSRLVGRKGAYAAWLLIPIVNIFIYAGLCVDLVRSFGMYKFKHSLFAVVYTPAVFFFLWFKGEKYGGPTLVKEKEFFDKMKAAREGNKVRQLRKLQAENPYKKSVVREWTEAIIFAVFAAAFIRMFLIEAYTIPTSSMEGSLLVGDFLFVSKAHFGIRTPETILMVPLLHNRIPYLNTESYLAKPNLPYFRLPALEKIDHNEPVVFNFPEGDSVYVFPERTWTIYDYQRGAIPPVRSRQIKSGKAKLVCRPIDKKDHYIKRCIAIPGDSLEIKNRQVYINGQPAKNPSMLQYIYKVNIPGGVLNTAKFNDWGIYDEDVIQRGQNFLELVLNEEQKEKIKALDPSISIEHIKIPLSGANHLFPHDPVHFHNWTVDDYGPIYVPKKGATIKISPENIALYRRIIEVYEGNKLKETGGKFFINGKETDSYTFKMNYFWMMGDNRHNSEDARVWGFVPENHIVGKPLFIWFSTRNGSIANGIRWNRLFTSANKM